MGIVLTWIVLNESKRKIILISKSNDDSEEPGILHIGSYLTVEDPEYNRKHILRVEDTVQYSPYSPSPLIADIDLTPLIQDQKCQNVISTNRIMEHPPREDGKSSFIRPQLLARISTQQEIDIALGCIEGIPIFPATVFARTSQHLLDNEGKYVQAKIPEDVFFHQILVTGSTGSGKTVAMKYLAQYFIEKLDLEGQGPGAVIAVNVKEEDMLTLDQASSTNSSEVIREWSDLGVNPHGVETFRVYYPGAQKTRYSDSVTEIICEQITLKAEHIEPETLAGLIQHISELGAAQLPAIFRYWQEKIMKSGDTLAKFVEYFSDPNKKRQFNTMNIRGDELEVTLHPSTFNNVLNSLVYATDYFDVADAKELSEKDIIQHGKMSVIDVTAEHGFGFGSVLLRDLLNKIYRAKSQKKKDADIPVLIIIDEVHEFYGSQSSREALQTLDAICRKGRSLMMGVIFASQNPSDMPKGIENVVNTRIQFRSENIRECSPEALRKGYAVARIHDLGQLKFVKFPLSLAGVHDARKSNG